MRQGHLVDQLVISDRSMFAYKIAHRHKKAAVAVAVEQVVAQSSDQ